jgi:protocatechuate 3,4-dioxygenase beta subunit
MPADIDAIDTSAGWGLPAPKLLLTGTVYKRDGKTPAPGVILYYYQTDHTGVYANKPGLDRRVARHGYIRGWVKTDAAGRYSIYTIRPAPYRDGSEAAHIHPTILEPGIDNPYYIDEYVFDDDPLLTSAKRKAMQNRGGSGVLRLVKQGDFWIGERDIILGLNIPDYPDKAPATVQSGLPAGHDQPSFTPRHAWGPDKGSKACPVCKYGRYQGILYFVGKDPNWEEIGAWLKFLDAESNARGKYLKAYFIYGGSTANGSPVGNTLASLGQRLGLQHVALTWVPSFTDETSDVHLSRISDKVENTFIIYRRSRIVETFVNISPSPAQFNIIRNVLDSNKGRYFTADEG